VEERLYRVFNQKIVKGKKVEFSLPP